MDEKEAEARPVMGTIFLVIIGLCHPIELLLKSVRVHFAYGSDGRSLFVEYS